MVGITFSDFAGNMKDLARPNRFLFTIITPPPGMPNNTFTDKMVYHVGSASIPTRSLGDVTTLFWFGQNFKLAGDPTYDDYTVKFYNDDKWVIRNYMERWVDLISNTTSNIRSTHDQYKAILKIDQIGKGDQTDILATYYMHGALPKTFAAIALDTTTADGLEEFDVTFGLDYWSSSPNPASAGNPSNVGTGQVRANQSGI